MNTRTNSIDALKMLFGLNYEVLKKNLEGIYMAIVWFNPRAAATVWTGYLATLSQRETGHCTY
jgi:hypothetical protein